MVFEPGDWLWVHLREIRFPDKTKGKLAPKGDGPFLVLERINDNVYVIDLPGEYNVSYTFSVTDLSPFNFVGGPDLRTNPFQEGEDDTTTPGRPMTRRLHEGISTFIQKAMQEESTKTDEHATRLVLKFEGWELRPGRVASEVLPHPGRVSPLESPRPSSTTRPGDLSATHPGGPSKA